MDVEISSRLVRGWRLTKVCNTNVQKMRCSGVRALAYSVDSNHFVALGLVEEIVVTNKVAVRQRVAFSRKRKATKKRNTSAEGDSAAMQRYCDKLRYILQQPPAGDVVSEGSLAFGHFSFDRRFNVDQISLEFDVSCKHGTWTTAEERSAGVVHIRGGRSGWEKRFATWQVCLSVVQGLVCVEVRNTLSLIHI